jgi:hypothetical protein
MPGRLWLADGHRLTDRGLLQIRSAAAQLLVTSRSVYSVATLMRCTLGTRHSRWKIRFAATHVTFSPAAAARRDSHLLPHKLKFATFFYT